jgi:hypothetical protein
LRSAATGTDIDENACPYPAGMGGYLHRFDADSTPSMFVAGGWYLGGQVISTNCTIGADGLFDPILELIGLTGFESTGIGLVTEYDTRDNLRNPSAGRFFSANNIAYRESLGGDESFDVYSLKFSEYVAYLSMGNPF